jgi:hypothetical protein
VKITGMSGTMAELFRNGNVVYSCDERASSRCTAGRRPLATGANQLFK